MRSHPFRACFASLLLLVGSLTGCQCGIGIADNKTGQPPSANGANQEQTQGPNTEQGSVPYRYQIRGVAMLAFYPMTRPNGEINPMQGSVNGYLVLYKKRQSTEIAAWALKDDTCHFDVTPQTNKPQAQGLDAGDALSVAINGKDYPLTRRGKQDTPTGIVYNIPTREDVSFPYNKTITFRAQPASQTIQQGFSISLSAPAALIITQPTLYRTGLDVKRVDGLALRWQTKGEMPYMAVRINQFNPDKKTTKTLLCRFSNSGSALLDRSWLAGFAPDTEGKHTHIYFSPTTYKLASIPPYVKPLLTVVRATTTLPLRIH